MANPNTIQVYSVGKELVVNDFKGVGGKDNNPSDEFIGK